MEHSSKEQVFEILFQHLRNGGIEGREADAMAIKLTEAMAIEGNITNNEASVEYKLIYVIEGLTKVQQLLSKIVSNNDKVKS